MLRLLLYALLIPHSVADVRHCNCKTMKTIRLVSLHSTQLQHRLPYPSLEQEPS